MIRNMPRIQAAISTAGAVPWSLLFVLLALPAGCLSDRTNTLSRTARMRELEAERVLTERRQRELQILRQLAQDIEGSIQDAKRRSIAASAQLRAVMVELDRQLGQLAAAEQDLAAARQRAAAIAQELQPVRELEALLARREADRAAVAAKLAALEPELAKAEQALAAKTAELAPKLAALQLQLEAVAKVEAALTAAQAAAAAAGGVLAPAAQPPQAGPEKK